MLYKKKSIMKIVIPIAALLLGVLAINKYNKYKDEQLIDRIMKSEYNPRTMIKIKLEEKRQQEEYNNKVQEQINKIAEYKRSEEYKLREETRSWRLPLGITVDQLQPMTFKNTAYSSLPEENGGYTVTCNGEPLVGNIVANNILSQGTRIYMDGEIYTVADRGSSRFNNPNRLDVLVERLPGENINSYKQRVSDYGVKYVQGYIIKEGS